MGTEILLDTNFTRVIKIQGKTFKLVYINESSNKKGGNKYGFEINILLSDNTWKQVATELDTDFLPECGTGASWEEKLKDKNRYYMSMLLYIEKVFLSNTGITDKKYTNIPISGILLESGCRIGRITLDNNMIYDFERLQLTEIRNIHTKEEYDDIFIHGGMQLSDGAYLAQTITGGIRIGHTELILNGASKFHKNMLLTMISAIADGAKLAKRSSIENDT